MNPPPATSTTNCVKVRSPTPHRIDTSTFTNVGAVWNAARSDGLREAVGVVTDMWWSPLVMERVKTAGKLGISPVDQRRGGQLIGPDVLGHDKVSLGDLPDVIHSQTLDHLDEHQPFGGHFEYGLLGDDDVDHALAGDRKTTLLQYLRARLAGVLHGHHDPAGAKHQIHR